MPTKTRPKKPAPVKPTFFTSGAAFRESFEQASVLSPAHQKALRANRAAAK